MRNGAPPSSSFADVVQSALTIQRAYRIYKKKKIAGVIKKKKPAMELVHLAFIFANVSVLLSRIGRTPRKLATFTT